MPLVLAAPQVELEVIKILGREKDRKFLNNLGIIVGEIIELLVNEGGNVVVKVKESRLALDSTMARRILVKEV